MLTSLKGRRTALRWAARGGPEAKKAMKQFQKSAVALAYARQDLHTGQVRRRAQRDAVAILDRMGQSRARFRAALGRSEEHTAELQSRGRLVCRLLLDKK